MISGPPHRAWCNINNHLIREAPKSDVVDFVLKLSKQGLAKAFLRFKKDGERPYSHIFYLYLSPQLCYNTYFCKLRLWLQ